MSDSELEVDPLQDLERAEDLLQELEQLRDLVREEGWKLFKGRVLDFLAKQWAAELETAREESRMRQLQGGLQFYRAVLGDLKNVTDPEGLEDLRARIEEMRHGEDS